MLAKERDMRSTAMPRDELLSRATKLVPVVGERAARAEQLRRLPDETLADLINAGLFRIGNPDRFGGVGLDVDTVFDVAVELGRGCGSTAWVYGVLAAHNWMLGLWPEQAQFEYFAAGPDTLASSSLDPGQARVETVAGGYRLAGRWSFSSGCDAASWVMVGGLGPNGLAYFLVPMAEVTIVDTWFVSGLRGTGSKDLVIENAFVPTHRVAELRLLGEGQTDGWALHRRPSYRVPLRSILSLTLAAPALGMARGVVEAFTSQLRDRRGPSGASLIESVASQLHLAEASAEVDAAIVLLRHDTREMLDLAARGEMPTLLDRARYRRDQAFMTRLALRAVNRLMETSGGHALQESNPLQRLQRDLQAAAQHFSLRWEETAEQYGRVALGLDPAPTARL
jgi:3-hydroxy-9,10-secoandrosta-1,3,5(10)-triene-9,17-dione monooxygenase